MGSILVLNCPLLGGDGAVIWKLVGFLGRDFAFLEAKRLNVLRLVYGGCLSFLRISSAQLSIPDCTFRRTNASMARVTARKPARKRGTLVKMSALWASKYPFVCASQLQKPALPKAALCMSNAIQPQTTISPTEKTTPTAVRYR